MLGVGCEARGVSEKWSGECAPRRKDGKSRRDGKGEKEGGSGEKGEGDGHRNYGSDVWGLVGGGMGFFGRLGFGGWGIIGCGT